MDIHTVAWLTTAFFMLLVIVVFGVVALNASKERVEYQPVQKKWYRARTFYGVILVVLMLVVTIYSLRNLPYDMPVYSKGETPTIVDAEGMQFGWSLSETEFEVGEAIQFNITSADVNHGFGVYNDKNQLIAQAQAMPDYTNELYITFEHPGTYKILCLEYCGLAHHLMQAEITVTE